MTIDTLLHDSAHVTDAPGPVIDRGRLVVRARATRRRRMRLAIVAAAAAAAVAVPVIGFDGGRPADSAAADVLKGAGAAAGRQQGGWPHAAYWHSVSQYTRDGGTFRREIWIAHHGTGILRDPGVDSGLIPLGDGEFPAGSSGLSWDGLYGLPTDPTRLAARLRAGIDGAGNGDDSELFVIVGDLLRESPASPALREALYEVAAQVPGVHADGPVTDSIGRHGVGVSRDGDQYVIDPDTGQLLQESEGAGWTATYLSQGPAASEPTR